MSDDPELRLSQLIQTFGPGAIVDLPNESVMITGLEQWPLDSGRMVRIEEPRMVAYLTKALSNVEGGGSWIDEDTILQLFQPPLNVETEYGRSVPKVPAVIYPRWEVVSDTGDPDRQLLRRVVSGKKNKPKKTQTITPIRWLAACAVGHVDDIDWRRFCHSGRTSCQQDMYLHDQGAAGDPQFITIVCDCGDSRVLSELYTENALGGCQGQRPWIKNSAAEECSESQRAMTRGAINNYYSQVLKLIALPAGRSDLDGILERFLSDFEPVTTLEKVSQIMELGSLPLRTALEPFAPADIWQALQKIRAGHSSEATAEVENPKLEEFDIFASGKPIIGEDSLNSRLHAETLKGDEWRDDAVFDTSFIRSLVKVHRLCEVSSLYGFTRIEPAPSPFDEIQEDITLEVRGQPLAEKITWLPAMEQFGEGLFLHLDIANILNRIRDAETQSVLSRLEQRYTDWQQRDVNRRPEYPGAEYVFAHSLSHMLIEQVSLHAGYASTALSERIYSLRRGRHGAVTRLGILVYAAGAGSQGTLGGLLEQSTQLPRLIADGVRRSHVCSNDPICSTDAAFLVSDADMINGAACHGCLFTAETSCERRNTLLDRQSLLRILDSQRHHQ